MYDADAYKDLSKRKLVAVCVRYLHNSTLKERAVGFVEMDNMTERSCDVRWSSWSNAVSKVFTLLGPILEMLTTFSESSSQTKLEADTLLHQMQKKKVLFLHVTFNQLFRDSDYTTKGLQSAPLSLTDCIDLIEGLKDSDTQFRNENEAFDKVMALRDELMNKHEIDMGCLWITHKEVACQVRQYER